MKRYIFISLIVYLATQSVYTYSILFVLPYSGKSHYINIKPIIDEMVFQGHNVTVISPFQEKNVNYRQIIAKSRMMWETLEDKADYLNMASWSKRRTLNFLWDSNYYIAEAVFETPAVVEFVRNDRSHFDLIFFELIFQESMFMFMHKYNAPGVSLSTGGCFNYIINFMGGPIEFSYIKHWFLKDELEMTEMTFVDRFRNLFSNAYDLYWRKHYHMVRQQRLADKYFKHLPGPLPRLEELEKNISIAFVSTHFSYDGVRPYVPGVIEVAGLHVLKPKPLPERIKKFLDDAKDGAVYFSLGTNVNSKDLSREKIKMLTDAFKQLKQRVVLKWEDEFLPNAPNNVMTSKWMPQSDILAHPNLKLFITHGGLLSVQEAMHRGVPLLVIPFISDQYFNAKLVVWNGFGLTLDFDTLDAKTLRRTIEVLVNGDEYQQRAREISEQFRDRPNTPMETVVFWMEYVIRHKGAPFMKSPALNIPFLAYYSLDIALFVLVSVILVVLLLYLICCGLLLTYRRVCYTKSNIKRD